MNLIKAVTVGSFLLAGLFCADLLLNFSALSILYICFIFFSLFTNEDKFVFGTVVISSILVMIAWIYNGGGSTSDDLVRLLSMVVIWATGLLSIQRQGVENRLKMLNETLELRVLARTATAEERSKRLEKQIKLLQNIRYADTKNSLHQLDEIISNLKEISTLEDD